MDQNGLWIVIPAYNEAQVVEGVVRAVVKKFEKVVVVDDCSEDDTFSAAQRSGAHVLRHPINLGQGAALQTGISYALRQGATHIAMFDADGQHDIRDLHAMLELQKTTGVDCVLGSRFIGRAIDMPRERRLLLQAAVLYTRLTAGLAVTDAHNGLRLFSRTAASRIKIRQNRMAHASELIEQIRSHGLSWA
jgi:glycosyltransferase involved in cell wall biosynthesis